MGERTRVTGGDADVHAQTLAAPLAHEVHVESTAPGMVGTPAYMAPEQVEGANDLDARGLARGSPTTESVGVTSDRQRGRKHLSDVDEERHRRLGPGRTRAGLHAEKDLTEHRDVSW